MTVSRTHTQLRIRKGRALRIGVIACNIMRRELDNILSSTPGIEKVIYLEEARHINPARLRETVIERIESIKGEVDAVFLGYGRCNSLDGIAEMFDIPVILPDADDCIAILLTPERYREELEKEAGTWFMTPGWAEAGVDMVMKELHMERFAELGVEPDEMTRELFAHYRRGLYIDTGVGQKDYFMQKAAESCEVFGVGLESTVSDSTILQDNMALCVKAAAGRSGNQPSPEDLTSST